MSAPVEQMQPGDIADVLIGGAFRSIIIETIGEENGTPVIDGTEVDIAHHEQPVYFAGTPVKCWAYFDQIVSVERDGVQL